MFGYHLTGSTGTLFLFGILVGAVGLLELRVFFSGPQRTAGRGPDAQPPASNVKWRSSTEPATPGSNTNSEPTAPRSHWRAPMKARHGGAEIRYRVAGHAIDNR